MYGSSQTRRVKGRCAFMLGCTSGSGVFIWKHAALSHPRVPGVFEVFRFKFELKVSVCPSVCLSSSTGTLPCHFRVVLPLLAGRAAVKALDFPWELHRCSAHTLRLPLPSRRLAVTRGAAKFIFKLPPESQGHPLLSWCISGSKGVQPLINSSKHSTVCLVLSWFTHTSVTPTLSFSYIILPFRNAIIRVWDVI